MVFGYYMFWMLDIFSGYKFDNYRCLLMCVCGFSLQNYYVKVS